MIVCLAEILAAPFVSNNIWYASLGFLVGSFIGFLVSYSWTTKLLSEFDHNAFRAFQKMEQKIESAG
jgi:uncharacterized membrane protein